MEKLIRCLEKTIESISFRELSKNPKATAMALEIKRKLSEIKKVKNESSSHLENQGVLKYIHPKSFLEN